MTAKQLLFREDARDKIRRRGDALADAVKFTLGPRGRTVILEREFGPPQIVNSGVVVAKAIEFEDRCENMGAQLLREVAARTSEMAGDGDSRNHCLVGRALRAAVGSQSGSVAPDTGVGANFARQGSVAQSDVEGFIHGRDLVEPAIAAAPRIGQYHAAGRETMVRPALAGAARRWSDVLPREAATWFV